ncbi:hypothetical protein F5Y09DRAFT_356390 [Xylaria sp. FL1042]|nr:hypothetical protein F5Y09DRAFT_356390 [Xylaria sp. FL1042]
MEPFSIAASALQVAAFAGSLIKCIAGFVEQTKNIADWIHKLHYELCNLKDALHDIDNMFSKRPQQLSFEYRHHDRIYRILQSCKNALEDLKKELPDLKDETTPIQKVGLSIQKSLKRERLTEIIHRITSYTSILQLSLSTLSLGELWMNRQSQDLIIDEVRKIHHAIRDARLFPGRAESRARSPRELPMISAQQPDVTLADEEADSVLDKEIHGWRETVDEISAAVSLSLPHDNSTDERLPTSTSSTTLQTFDNEGSDSEQEELDENQQIAAEYQRRGIKRRKDLDELFEEDKQDDDVSSTFKLIDMEEKLADILFHCNTAQTDKEAKGVLEDLLDHERGRVETDDADRQWRLNYKLGNLYVRQGNFRRSRKFLKSAFMGRSRSNPRSKSLIIESAEMLIKSLQALQLIDEAWGIQSWLEEELPTECDEDHEPSPPSSPRASVGEVGEVGEDGDLISPYLWSKEQGFDVRSPHFGFNVYDPRTGNAPIHLAIQHQNIGVLQRRDSSGSTPMHLAASTRNKQVVAMLLDKGANVDVVDQKNKSPLHRCQARLGGIQVAELILNRSPSLIDRIDYIGKTALYMACESGNEQMVAYLLSRGAKPNRDGPTEFIPLVSAIDAVAQSRAKIRLVKLLLEYGADAGLRDGSGRTALEAANNAGLAGGEIKKRKQFSSRFFFPSRFSEHRGLF